MTGERSGLYWNFRKEAPGSLAASPLLLAEDVPPSIAENNIRHNSQRKTAVGFMQSAWWHVEYALAQKAEVDTEMRRTYLGYASQLLANVVNLSSEQNPLSPAQRASPRQPIYHEALLLGSYLPVFTKRAVGSEVTRQDSVDVYRSLGVVLNGLLEYGDGADSPISEAVASALSARTTLPEHLLYLSSPREEGSHTGVDNHDRYFLEHGVKQPVEIKLQDVERPYNPRITVLNMEELLVWAAERAELTAPDPSPSRSPLSGYVHQTAELISRETTGSQLARQEKAFLNLASGGIVRYHRTARESQVPVAA